MSDEHTSKGDDIKRIDIKEFRDEGYLQEVNRQFLHPLGLALEVVQDPDGSERLGGVWDYRDDPDGMCFAENLIDPAKAINITAQQAAKAVSRMLTLGYVIQPIGKGAVDGLSG